MFWSFGSCYYLVDKHQYFGHNGRSLVHNSGTYGLNYKLLPYNKANEMHYFSNLF